jgi:FixJ family two-component response regulator
MKAMSQVPAISIVDDDPSVRIATSRLVRSLGYSVTTFASACDFLSYSKAHEASCLIADVQMPGISGIELQNLMIARGCSTPIIFITAFPEASIRLKALKAGAVALLGKPFDESALIESIDIALGKREAR